MAGMRALGRVLDIVPIASGKYISMKNASGITFVCTGADTFNVSEAKTVSGTPQDVGAVITQYYQQAGTDGTHGWTTVTQTAADEVVQANAGYTTVIEIFGDMMDDGYAYIACTAAASGLVAAIVHDLTVQRKPDNLVALSA